MLCIGTTQEVYFLRDVIPDSIFNDILRGVAVLDAEYGETRNYYEEGGYSVLIEGCDDLTKFRLLVDYEAHPCEWVIHSEPERNYLCALYLLNDDFSILLYLPVSLAPEVLLQDLED